MVEFLTLLKSTLRKFKLQAEIAVLDRNATKRQRAFGVELFDLIQKQKVEMHAHIANTIEKTNPTTTTTMNSGTTTNPKSASTETTAETTTTTTPTTLQNNNSQGALVSVETVEGVLGLFQAIENEIRDPLATCRKDVNTMTDESISMSMSMSMSSIHSPSIYLPIRIRRRKEQFGIEIWPIVGKPKLCLHESLEEVRKDKDRTAAATATSSSTTTSSSSDGDGKSKRTDLGGLVTVALKSVVEGTKTTITKAIGKLSPEERDVQACVMVAKQEVAVYEAQKTEKLVEIEELVSGGTTLECC